MTWPAFAFWFLTPSLTYLSARYAYNRLPHGASAARPRPNWSERGSP